VKISGSRIKNSKAESISDRVYYIALSIVFYRKALKSQPDNIKILFPHHVNELVFQHLIHKVQCFAFAGFLIHGKLGTKVGAQGGDGAGLVQ